MEELIKQALAGNQDAYIDLIKPIQPELYRIASSRLNNIDDINDAIQETIINSYANLHTLKNYSYFKTWIIKILINECNDIYKKQKKQLGLFNKISNSTDIDSFTEKEIQSRENDIDFDLLINKLNYDEQLLLTLYYKNNYTQAEISDILKINVNTVKSRLLRAKRKLKKLYDKRDSKNEGQNSLTFNAVKKIIIFILCIGIITFSTVYAKEIADFITNFFTNSNAGVDKAVDNGYVQNVDMNFVECNNVGVKVDYLLMDEYTLDISFVYKYFSETSTIKALRYADLIIKDENNNILCYVSENPSDSSFIFGTSIRTANEQQFLDNTTVRESVLIGSEEFPASQKLYIEISRMSLITDEEIKYIDGNWDFSINIDDKLVERNSYEYSATDSPYITDIKTSLTATSLSIELHLNTLFNEAVIGKHGAITLKDENNNTYSLTKMLYKNDTSTEPYTSDATLFFSVSFYNNIDKLYLHINLDVDKEIDIELSK